MKIAIPSYRRAETVKKKTLAYLAKCNVPQQDIYIFVANSVEAQIYKNALRGYAYNIITGVETLQGQRGFIQQWFSPGEFILNFDDDVDGLFYADFINKKLELLTDLTSLAALGEKLMLEHGTKIFGVYAVANHFFMNPTPSTDLKYIVGCFWGCIIDPSPELQVELEDKEDFERSIKYYIKFGAVVRINSVCVKTNYYKEPGGMQVTRTKKRVTDSALALVEKYPYHCKINTAKKNEEFAEVKLISSPVITNQQSLF